MSNIWEKWDNNIDVEGLKADEQEIEENGGLDYKEVPHGTYEVAIDQMELKESKKGDPMLSIWFKIVAGEFKGSIIFYNQVLTTGFGIHNAKEILRSLDSGLIVEFDSYKQFNDLIMDIFEIVNENLEYAIEYGKNKKGYNTYKITEVYEN